MRNPRIGSGLITAVGLALLATVAGRPGPVEGGTTFVTVDTTSDASLTACTAAPGDCSLRGALETIPPGDDIFFNIPSSDSSWDPAEDIWTISPASPLPILESDDVQIDGFTQPGVNGPDGSPNTNPVGQPSNAVIKIEIDGFDAGGANWGLAVDADDTEIRGLAIGRFTSGIGIAIIDGSGNQINGNYIGTDPDGTAARGNGNGIFFAGPANSVGSSAPQDRNVIVDNDDTGITLGTSGNTVYGNFIGVSAGGAALGNGDGVEISSPGVNFIGGATTGQRNVISANNVSGVRIVGNTYSGNIIQGNYIGTTISGSAARANGTHGLLISAPDTIVGGTGPGQANVISGNGGEGIQIIGPRNIISGNLIGTNAAGTAPISNAGSGVRIGSDAPILGTIEDNVVSKNLISGNTQHGVRVQTSVATGATIQGNFIGLNLSGGAAIPNGFSGVRVDDTPDVQIGGTQPGDRNVISGNAGNGLRIDDTENTVVEGNYIGTNAGGTAAIPNNNGISFGNGAMTGLRIGGSGGGEGNLISGNTNDGITSDDNVVAGTIQGNRIGTQANGTSPLGNGADGIELNNPISNLLIGGNSVDEGNTIAFNGGTGVNVRFSDDLGNRITANSIHSNGELGIDLDDDGVTPNDPGDADAGPNRAQNFPVLTQAQITNSVSIDGTFDSIANTTFRFDFFVNDECDPGGFGEGQTFIGAGDIATDGDGVITFMANSPADVDPGDFVTATATNLTTGDTSEFSNCIEVLEIVTPTPTPTPPGQTPTPTPTASPPGQTQTPTPTATLPGQTQTPTATPTSGPGAFTQGDNDCDGDEDAVDALVTLQEIAGLEPNQMPGCPAIGAAVPAGGAPPLFGDIDCDGDVDAVDALQILRHVAGLPVNQEDGCPAVGEQL